MGWWLRGATVGWCCAILVSTAGMGRVGSTGVLPGSPERPPASVTRSEWQPPLRTAGARRASTTPVSSTARRRGAALEVAEPLLQAYRTAALVVSPACHLPVSLLAAIGQVESGNLAGHRLDARHRAVPRVIGPALDGDPFGRVPDTDDGVLDGDRKWDRAVGPMQFLPATWIAYAVDLDGDGRLDPQDVEDAAGSAAVYLCQSGGDLAEPASLRTAVLTYNHSRAYLRLVLAWMAAYDEAGLTAGSPQATLPAVLVRPAVARIAPDRTPARAKARSRAPAPKAHAEAQVAAVPRPAKPSRPGRDPVRPGGTSPWPVDLPPPPEEELPPCVTDPEPTDPPTDPPVTDSPTDPPVTDPPVTDPPTDPPVTEPPADPEPSQTASTPTPAAEPGDPTPGVCEPEAPGDPGTPGDQTPGDQTPGDPTDPAAPVEPAEPCVTCAP